LLGLCGAAGMAIAASSAGTDLVTLQQAAATLKSTRPTAVDLGHAIDRALQLAASVDEHARADALWDLCEAMLREQAESDAALGRHGASLLAGNVLTHCNTGPLATGAGGTALAAIIEAFRSGRLERCFATETRPLLQGARLTTWELQQAGVPVTLLPDTAAASLIRSGEVTAVMTGADRIAANGDTANKIGTSGLAIAAAYAGIPFYIVAPTTTVDLHGPDGAAIPIEFRNAAEVGGFGGLRWSPGGVDAYNPAFDVTPAALIAAIVTERGIARPPYRESLLAFVDGGGS
jgi:methylthioribose-1-phosphate isomerase